MIKKDIDQIAGELYEEFSKEDLIKLILKVDECQGSVDFSIDLISSLKYSYVDELGEDEYNLLIGQGKVITL